MRSAGCRNCGGAKARPYHLMLVGTVHLRDAFLCRRCVSAMTAMGMDWRKA